LGEPKENASRALLPVGEVKYVKVDSANEESGFELLGEWFETVELLLAFIVEGVVIVQSTCRAGRLNEAFGLGKGRKLSSHPDCSGRIELALLEVDTIGSLDTRLNVYEYLLRSRRENIDLPIPNDTPATEML
jgi:hypothetical protein